MSRKYFVSPFKMACFLLGILAFSGMVEIRAEGQRTLTFSSISFNGVPHDLWYESAGKLTELKPGGSIRGSTHSYTGETPIQFFRQESDGAGGFKKLIQAKAYIPEHVDKVLLCFLPDPSAGDSGKLPWHVYVMDDSFSAFGGGDIRFVNLTSKPVIGVLDGETMRLQPGAMETIVPDSNKERGVGVKLAAYFGEKWEPFFSARWPYREKVRLLVLFMIDKKTNKIALKSIPQPVRNSG